jgi:diaminohydroxyphosphoribosylaminopyrimidine deaminase/5-amino-6-(5-phosphoribosylamino)uracil reductase
VIAAGITRVVAACPDPNPKVSGRGFEKLRQAGITVEVGLGRERAEELYAGFFFWVRHGRPQIVVKIAESLDGRINAAPGRRTRLTGSEALAYAHGLRARADAILIGGRTLRVDDPDLTPRRVSPAGGPAPEVLVLSRHAPPSPPPRIFAPGRVSGTLWGSPHRPRDLPDHVGHFTVNADGSPTAALLDLFRQRGYHEVLVEGGRGVWAPFLNEGLCDKLALVTAPVRMPGGEAWGEGLHPGWVKPLEFHRFTPLGRDTLTEFARRVSS